MPGTISLQSLSLWQANCIKAQAKEENLTKDDVPRLSNRELEVLKWIKEGKTSYETSVILSISERTVNFHVGNIIRKLDVINRIQAVAKALEKGLIGW